MSRFRADLLRGGTGRLVARGAAIAVLALLTTHVFSHLWPPWTEETLSLNYPVEEVAFLKASGVGGATFHTFVSGGYLDLEYYPLGRILFDGRYFPFKDILTEYVRSKQTADDLQAFLEKYPFQIALHPYTNATIASDEPGAPPRGACTVLFPPDRWTLTYMGAYGAVYVRNGQVPEVWREQHGYSYLVPGDEAYLAWAVQRGLVPKDGTLSEIGRALREGSAAKGRPQLESLRLGLLQIRSEVK